LRIAYKVLRGKEFPYDIIPFDGASNLAQALKCFPLIFETKIIALFDYDIRGIDCLRKVKSIKPLGDNFLYQITRRNDKSIENNKLYAMHIPCPKNEPKVQDYLNCPIEFLYGKKILEKQHGLITKMTHQELQIYFSKLQSCFSKIDKRVEISKYDEKNYDEINELWTFFLSQDSGKKMKFAKYIEDNAKSIDFSNFEQLFKNIEFLIEHQVLD
jgi:hypothetical protein